MAQHRQQQDGAPAQEPPRPGNLEVKASGAAIFARTVTSVTALAEGYDFGSFSGVLVLLMEDVALSSTQVGVLLSSIFVGMIIGAPLGGALADTSGRKKALFLSYTGLIVGCLAMSLSSSFAELLVGRLVQGVGIGAGFSVVTTYITEVSPSDKRGLYVCLEELFVVVGVTCGYWFNFLLAGVPNDWRWMLGIGAAPACLAMLLLLSPRFLESPRWRMLQGQTQQATVDLVSLVGDREAHKMLEQWKERQQPDIAWSELICPQGKWRRRSTFAGIGVLAAQQLCGISMLSAYIASILSAELPPRQAFFSYWLAWLLAHRHHADLHHHLAGRRGEEARHGNQPRRHGNFYGCPDRAVRTRSTAALEASVLGLFLCLLLPRDGPRALCLLWRGPPD